MSYLYQNNSAYAYCEVWQDKCNLLHLAKWNLNYEIEVNEIW